MSNSNNNTKYNSNFNKYQLQQNLPLITCRLLNANNYGSIYSNKRIVIAYCNLETNFESSTKMFIGCFINPADIALSYEFNKKQNQKDIISNNIFYFKQTIGLNKMFNVEDLLKNVIWSKSYQNSVTKKILYEKYNDIISMCEQQIKQKIFNY